MAAEPVDASLAPRIRAERVDILYGHIGTMQATNVAVALVLAFTFRHLRPPAQTLGWLAAVVAVALMRIALLRAYRRRRPASSVAWQHWMTASSALSGAVWGAAGLLFFAPEHPGTLVFITITLAGMTAGAMVSHAAWPPAQASYAALTMSPIALRYLLGGGPLWGLGIMCLLFLGAMLSFSLQLAAAILDSIRLRFRNQDLVLQLSEEKRLAEAARCAAEDANLAKSRILAAASHDLRQPLQSLSLLIEVLRNEKDASRHAELAAYLRASTGALDDLLGELLDMSRLEAGVIEPVEGPVAVSELFAALEREMRPLAEQKGLELGFVASRAVVHSDATMLARILRNIVANAIHHTEQGAVLVGCRRRADGVAIAVYDTGPGIAPEHHQAIFREFYQISNLERDRRKGLGLGLSIVDGLCRLLGHRVHLRSTPGRGSAFFVELGLARSETAAAPEALALPAFDLGRCSVLVIDDDPAIGEATVQLLRTWGCSAHSVETQSEALARLAQGLRPDLLIVDFRLREGVSGPQAVAAVRAALGEDLPALLVTGDTAPQRLREAQAAGIPLLHKPVQPARLHAVLAGWCEQIRASARRADAALP